MTDKNLNAAPKGLDISESEKTKARAEGAKAAVQEAAKDAYVALTDGEPAGDPEGDKYAGSEQITDKAYWLEMGTDEFAESVADKDRISEVKVAGLLKLERAGQNRTPYVAALVKRLGIKSPYEVTSAGPDYTNDVTAVTKL